MNAEQLHTVAKTVIEDVQETRILRFFSRFAENLIGLSNNPGDEGTQRNVQTSWSELIDALNMLGEKRWPAGYRQTISNLGGGILVSNEIISQIETSFQTEAMTPATIRDRVNEMQNDITTFVGKLETLTAAFEDLDIGEEELEPGEVELGVLIPREHIENRLNEFAREVKSFDDTLKSISVVATGTREEFEITYISASDLKVFLMIGLVTAALTNDTVTFVLNTLNGIANLKRTLVELENQEVHGEPVQSLRKFIEEKFENDVESFLPDIVNKYCSELDEHDKHENCNRLRKAINFLAPRLERGYVMEIRVGPLPESEEDDEDENGDKEEGRDIDWELMNRLQAEAQELKSLEPIGDPILELEKPDWATSGDSEDTN